MATVTSLSKMKNAGILRDLPSTEKPIEFRKFNLIYGFNGSGKTTLARMLESISHVGRSRNLPDDIEFNFILSSGAHHRGNEDDGHPVQNMFVFCEDFIERSLTWGKSEASPVVYIGQEQGEIAERLADLEGQRPALQSSVVEISAEWSAADKTEKKHCTDAARSISEQLGIIRGYDARSLRTDYESGAFTEQDRLTEDERNALRKAIFETNPPEPLDVPSVAVDIAGVLAEAQRSSSLKLEVVALEDLERRKDALPWIESGLSLHEGEQDCLFCGNDLTQERLAQLRQSLSSGFDELNQALSRAAENLRISKAHVRHAQQTIDGLPSLHASLLTRCDEIRSEISGKLQGHMEIVDRAAEAVAAKQANPTIEAPFEVPPTFGSDSEELEQLLGRLRQLFRDHNEISENHAQAVESQRLKLKRHFLAETHQEFTNLKALAADSKMRLDAADKSLAEVDSEIRQKRVEISEYGPAADRMNALIASYVGHNRISIEVQGDGYTICRDGEVISKPLSEGERTAIAFCYFLVLLEGEGRKLDDLIVVIDDPISSLDTRAMSHVVSLIKFTLGSCSQLFVMTHNIDFLWEMKKWLNRKRLEDEAAFLFVNTRVRPDGSRQSNFQELPAIIREYESEYHYLYSLVHKAAAEEAGVEDYMYLLPNALRKLLETYLAFKRPGFADLSGLVSLIESVDELDRTRVRALESLAQSESHAQSIGQTITFSQYTLEQIVDASKAFLHLVELTDPLHFERMEKLSRKVPALAA